MMSGRFLTRSHGSREGRRRAYLVRVVGRSKAVGVIVRVVGLVMAHWRHLHVSFGPLSVLPGGASRALEPMADANGPIGGSMVLGGFVVVHAANMLPARTHLDLCSAL